MPQPVALVHDYLTQRGGAERVVATWCDGFPDAPLYTTLYDPDGTFARFRAHDVRTSWLNRVAPLRRHHRWALPMLAPTVSHWRVDADVVLASSSGWAHGVRTDGKLLVYCHAPARWLYQRDRYLADDAHGRSGQSAVALLGPTLRDWDQRAARRADRYVVNSSFTRDLVRAVYGRDADVIAPPVSLPPVSAVADKSIDVLVVARLLPYKNVDLALAVARLLPDRRVTVVGDGPLRDDLRRGAPPNVTFTGAVTDEQLWSRYAAARVHLALSHEDFGLTPLEAAHAGVPTVARHSGGYLDTITAATGILVAESAVTPSSVRDAVVDALTRRWDEEELRRHAATFAPEHHLAKLRAVLSEL